MMTNLIAYIPVLNRQYLGWLEKHQPFNLFLISRQTAEMLVPRLARNIVALSELEIALMIRSVNLNGFIRTFDIALVPLGMRFVMPDEDVCHALAEKYFNPDLFLTAGFEQVWGRWDMSAVKRQEPIIPDLEVSSAGVDRLRMKMARELGQKSPDWWRQIGAMAFRRGKFIATSFNRHYPTEYETVIFGDPRINFDAGDPAGTDAYLSLHAEEGIVTACAREGVPLKGASVWTTTFSCGKCSRLLADCQIKELLFSEGYSVLKGLETLKSRGIRVVKVN